MKYTNKIILKDAIKTFKDDQDKVMSPQETLNKFKPKLKSIDLGILNDTIRVDNGRLGIPVFFSTCGAKARKIIGTTKQMGKGATLAQAEASAIMELAERYSFFSFYKNNSNVFINTYKNITNSALSFDFIAQSVHDESDDLKIAKKIFQDLPLKWTWGHNLTDNKEMLIPIDWFYAINAFNGPSSGNCVEEAICQGICEVIERHVSALISKNKISTSSIRLDSIRDPIVLKMLKKYFDLNIFLGITDFTLDIGIPSIGVLAYDSTTFPESSEIIWTAGTATDPQKALSRALTEVAQLAGDFNTHSNYVASGLPKFTSINESKFVVNKDKTISIKDLPNISNDNIKIEIENCVDAISKLGMNTIVVNTTNPVLRIPSFYTIIPGAHFRERAIKTSVAMFLAKITTENFPKKEAIVRLKDMNKLLPNKYFIHFYIGKCYLELSKCEIALSFFSTSLKLNPDKQDVPSIYSYIAVCFKNLKKYKKAIQVLKKGEMFDKKRIDIHNLKGFCYFMLKNYEKSIKSFKKAVELDPSSAIDYANIASNYRNMGKKSKAINYYSLALKIDPSIEFARKNLDILISKL